MNFIRVSTLASVDPDLVSRNPSFFPKLRAKVAGLKFATKSNRLFQTAWTIPRLQRPKTSKTRPRLSCPKRYFPDPVMQPSDGSDLTALFFIGSARRALIAIGIADSIRRSTRFYFPAQRIVRPEVISRCSKTRFAAVARL